MVSEIKREESIRVRLSSEMKGRLEILAELMSVPAATLAAVAIGQWVRIQELSVCAIAVQEGGLIGAFNEAVKEQVAQQLKLFPQRVANLEEVTVRIGGNVDGVKVPKAPVGARP